MEPISAVMLVMGMFTVLIVTALVTGCFRTIRIGDTVFRNVDRDMMRRYLSLLIDRTEKQEPSEFFRHN